MTEQTKDFATRYEEAKRNLQWIREDAAWVKREMEECKVISDRAGRELEAITGRPIPRR